MNSYGYLIVNEGVKNSSFEVGLSCFSLMPNNTYSEFSKVFNIISDSKNPVKKAKIFISKYAGCDEASIVRKRVIAMSRIKKTISGEEFRFRLP